ncbi:Eukaryotic translation initiation factor 2A [Perkinsus olseni]|uniref:Eukaryotic translation initiation factor 2A n=1 Tax=Perkinsus olseni TaxID=32597 RepID=A0A7J6M7N6_PEROL|nr:Eukaryotic translation initiation factor 2A [Perkinsus olseni]
MDIAAVCKNGVEIYRFDFVSKSLKKLITLEGSHVTNAEGFHWNADGTLCACMNNDNGITVYDATKDYKEIIMVAKPNSKGFKNFYFSPLSNYMVTFERYDAKRELPNLALWSVAGRCKAVESRMKRMNKHLWPAMKWTDDEAYCVRILPDADILQVLNSRKASTNEQTIPGIQQIELSPSGPEVESEPKVACVVSRGSERKPAVHIARLSDPKNFVLSYSFPEGDDVTLYWNASGTKLLGLLSLDVDESGKSTYYGTNMLYLFDMVSNVVSRVACNSPIHDLGWCPGNARGDRMGKGEDPEEQFILISGRIPPETALLSTSSIKQADSDSSGPEDGSASLRTLKPVHSMGKAKRNTVCWNRYGRYAVVGGFGNMAGEMDFWDMAEYKVVGSLRAECPVISVWAPDGRHFSTATTWPRMRVDNKIDIYSYNGRLICRHEFDELYFATWKPSTAFHDVPSSPRALATALDGPPAPVASKAYRAPGKSPQPDSSETSETSGGREGGNTEVSNEEERRRGLFSALLRGEVDLEDLPPEERAAYGDKPEKKSKHPSSKGDGGGRRESSPEAKSSEASSDRGEARRSSPVRPVAAAAPPVPPPAPMVATPPSTPPPQRPKLAPAPERGWYYKDLSDTVQGPFSREAMRRWFERNHVLLPLLLP